MNLMVYPLQYFSKTHVIISKFWVFRFEWSLMLSLPLLLPQFSISLYLAFSSLFNETDTLEED